MAYNPTYLDGFKYYWIDTTKTTYPSPTRDEIVIRSGFVPNDYYLSLSKKRDD